MKNLYPKKQYAIIKLKSFLIFLLLTTTTLYSQNEKIAGFMFYNVENLFDTKKDSINSDEDFTPQGAKKWTYTRLRKKWADLAKVITNAGGWNLPVAVGLCEVENKWVLTSMLYETGLSNLHYDVIHYDSPDNRGIDVALLYKKDRLEIIESYPIPVSFGKNERPTRDILFVKSVLDNIDTLYLMVNHWPSRYGGAAVTQPKRQKAAQIVKSISDSLMHLSNNSKILIMGDFNEPAKSDVFKIDLDAGTANDGKWLISPALTMPADQGTLKFRHTWDIFDQIIFSRPVLTDTVGYRMLEPHLKIIRLPFLLQPDLQYGGEKLFRTYEGYKYTGGYSDHLPVWIDLHLPKN